MPFLFEAAQPGPVHRRILLLSLLGWLFDFYDLILYTFLVRPITADLGLSRMDHARALGLSFLATAVGGVVCAVLADRYGRRALISWTILIYSAGSLLSGLAPNHRTLLMARLLTGLGVGGEWAAGHALVAETFPPAYRGRAGALLQTGAPLGTGLAALVGVLLAPRIGWRACFIASSATAVLAFVARRGLPESDLWLAGRAVRVGAGLPRLLWGDCARKFYLALVFTTINGASYWLTYSWLPEYLQSRGLHLAQSGAYLGVTVVAQLVGYTSFGWLSDRLGRRRTFSMYALIMAAGLLPLSLGWTHLQGTEGGILSAMALVGVGTGTWSNFGPLLAELFPTPVRQTGMAGVYNLSRGAQFFAPVLVAALAPAFGLGVGISLAAVFAITAAGLIWVLPETRAIEL
jgi:MFS family permease